MVKFKVGDKVEIVAVSDSDVRWPHWASYHSVTKGYTGEVEYIDGEGDIKVCSTQFTHGFNTLWYPPEALRLVGTDYRVEVITTFKVGDMEFDQIEDARDHAARMRLNDLFLKNSGMVKILLENKDEIARLITQLK